MQLQQCLDSTKDTELSVTVVILSAKGNQKQSKLLSTRFERSMHWKKLHWKKYKTKKRKKNTTNEYRYFQNETL